MSLRHIILLIIIIAFFGIYIHNLIKFVGCDFKSDFKCEVIHGVGVIIPLIVPVIAWFDGDGE